MPEKKPSSNTSANTGKRWTDTYSPPKELEGLNGELAIHHSGRQASAGMQRKPSVQVTLPSVSEIENAGVALSKFFAIFFADDNNKAVLEGSRDIFKVRYNDAGVPLVPTSDKPEDWYEIRALLRAFGLLSRVPDRRIDMSVGGQDNVATNDAVQFVQHLPSVEVMEVVQRLAGAVEF